MRNLISLLLISLLAVSSAGFAGQATHLVVNCIPDRSLPPQTHCFDEVAGQPFTFWVIAVDAGYGLATDYTGTVHITSDDLTATLPPDYTFGAADGGIAPFVMTFHSVTSTSVPSFEGVQATDLANGISSGGGGFFVSLPPPLPSPAPALAPTVTALLAALLTLFAFRPLKLAIGRIGGKKAGDPKSE